MSNFKTETVNSVTEWAENTFGMATLERQFERAYEEMRELDKVIYSQRGSYEKIAEEAADVVICLYRIIGLLHPDAIEEKMAINRARKWNVDQQGCGQHKKESEPCSNLD